ncbi:MAG TPA: SAM-dependent methyltransferase [Polyangiaceae bacterium]|nr:SAM-dependent methyltransferase [Polyangiaceae bacterium]
MKLCRSLGLVALFSAACGGGGAPPATPAPVPESAVTVPAAPAASAAPSGKTATDYAAIIDAQDRDPEDRKLDAGRHPAEMLAFYGIAPGMKVAELGAGGGYTTELLARAVGPTGVVYAQNAKVILERYAEKPWSERLAKPVMKNVVRLNREFDDPFPPDVHDLDVVLIVLFYHDTVWLNVGREKMNRAVLAALRPGGIYGIVDHSAREGSGISDVQTFHRIEEKNVKDEVTAAGFTFVGEADFLRNPGDTRDWNDSPRVAGDRRGTSDRFVLKFQKP